MRTIARSSAAVAVAFAGLAVPATSALAATPLVHACVGSSISTAATGNPRLGQFISGVAHDPTSGSGLGVGDDVQALQTGLVPDSGFANTCNG
jgi:hypothetical protein